MFLNLLLMFSLGASATEVPKFTFLEYNKPAPFEGVLFDEYAISSVLSDYEIAAYSCDIRTQYELKKEQERFKFEFENLKIEHRSLVGEYDLFIVQKDKEILSLATALKKTSPRYKWLYFVGGILIGTAGSYGAYKAVND
tara:strand:+ start:25634 stop:26053 length:420 start_codon:yes stop_codon:yes gene_type:complete